MPHLPPAPARPLTRIASAVARRRFGQVPEPLTLWAHSRRVLLGVARFEASVGRWDALDRRAKALTVLRTAQCIGCSWCVDFGSFVHAGDVDEASLAELATWRTSTRFTPLERLCLDYAEAASATPVDVPASLVDALREHLSDEAVVELAMMVAVEHQRSRFNAGLGLTSQGYCDARLRPSTA